jgi:hypothetical protein
VAQEKLPEELREEELNEGKHKKDGDNVALAIQVNKGKGKV